MLRNSKSILYFVPMHCFLLLLPIIMHGVMWTHKFFVLENIWPWHHFLSTGSFFNLIGMHISFIKEWLDASIYNLFICVKQLLLFSHHYSQLYVKVEVYIVTCTFVLHAYQISSFQIVMPAHKLLKISAVNVVAI